VGGLEMRETATSAPVTTFSAWDISLHGAAAASFGMFDIGLAMKVIREKIWTESAGGFAVDAGVTVHPAEDLVLAAGVQHIGSSVTMVDDDFRLPATWRAGAGYTFRPSFGTAVLTAEVGKPLDNSPYAGAGIEYTPVRWVTLRTGMRFLDDTRDLTAGAGLRAGAWSLDYAFIPTDYSLGTVHRFTLGSSL